MGWGGERERRDWDREGRKEAMCRKVDAGEIWVDDIRSGCRC